MITRATATLLQIIADREAPLRRRIEACEGLLQYEAEPEAVEVAKVFLTSIFEDGETDISTRLDALKLMRKAEARRVAQPTVSAADAAANREIWRRAEMGLRRVALGKAGLWPPPGGWADDLRGKDYKGRDDAFEEVWQDAMRFMRAKSP